MPLGCGGGPYGSEMWRRPPGLMRTSVHKYLCACVCMYTFGEKGGGAHVCECVLVCVCMCVFACACVCCKNVQDSRHQKVSTGTDQLIVLS